MRAPFPYYGGKARLAELIADLLPPHRSYVEPFAGSAAVLFAKAPSLHEVINDRHGDVVTFFRLLRDRPDDLAAACYLTPYARDEYATASDGAQVDELEQARRFYVRATQAYNANAGGVDLRSSSWSNGSTRRGSSRAVSTAGRAAELMELAERLRTVVIDSDDALKVLRTYDHPDGVAYVDPPYLDSTRTSLDDRHRRARDYVHEFASEDDRALADVLHDLEGAVVLSGYPSPLYDELYADWHRLDVTVHRPSTNRRGYSGDTRIEVLWSNRQLAGQGRLDLDTDLHEAPA